MISNTNQFLIANMVQWGHEYCTQEDVAHEVEQSILDRCRKLSQRFESVSGMNGTYIPSAYLRPNRVIEIPNAIN